MSTDDTRQAQNEPRTTGSRSGLLHTAERIGPLAVLLLASVGGLLFASISYPRPGEPGLPAPVNEDRPTSKSRFTKLVILLILLVGLAWVVMLGVRYFVTKEPVTDVGDLLPGVAIFEDQTRYVGSLEGVQRPMGVAVSSDGKIYVTESGGERMVRIFNSDGVEISALAAPGTQANSRVPLYIAVSPSDQVYVSDRHNKAIYIWAADGSFVGTFEPQSVPAEDWHPMGLAFDQQGNLYVTDVSSGKHRVMVFDTSGALKLQFGKEGQEPGDFWFPNGVAVDSIGRIYVADGNNGRLQVFDAQGNLLEGIPRGFATSNLSMPRGVALDGEDHLLVTDSSAHTVKSYDISGEVPQFIRTIGTLGTGDGQVRYPNGVALANGKIYVTDRENGRVQIWSR